MNKDNGGGNKGWLPMVKHSSQCRACLLVPKTAARLIRLVHAIFPRPGLRRSGAVPHKEQRHQFSDRSAAAFSRNPHFADLRPTTIAFTLQNKVESLNLSKSTIRQLRSTQRRRCARTVRSVRTKVVTSGEEYVFRSSLFY